MATWYNKVTGERRESSAHPLPEAQWRLISGSSYSRRYDHDVSDVATGVAIGIAIASSFSDSSPSPSYSDSFSGGGGDGGGGGASGSWD